jgi:hypothetical protein
MSAQLLGLIFDSIDGGSMCLQNKANFHHTYMASHFRSHTIRTSNLFYMLPSVLCIQRQPVLIYLIIAYQGKGMGRDTYRMNSATQSYRVIMTVMADRGYLKLNVGPEPQGFISYKKLD